MSHQSYLDYWVGAPVENPVFEDIERYPVRCYFDNDSDELINYKGKNGLVDIEVYREMVRALKGMGYNAIDIHDQLGRAEFYNWDRYKKFWDYKGDIDHINALIDMIHEEGMLVQIPMYLAWAFNPIEEDAQCWHEHGSLWEEKWRDYMTSPLGKGDIFLLRPRSPVYDRKYGCQCPDCTSKGTGQVMTEAFKVLEDIILEKKQQPMLICDLYAEGYELWADGSFSVSDRWTMLFADSGYGKLLPIDQDVQNIQGGIYLHAGFWLNHTVQDPHIDILADSITKADELGLTNYILVNGQSFKNFVFNIEAIMHMVSEGEHFSRHNYITDWCQRILGIMDAELIQRIDRFILDIAKVHEAIAHRPAYLDQSDLDRGFTGTMFFEIYPLIQEVNALQEDGCDRAKGNDNSHYGWLLENARSHCNLLSQVLKTSEDIESTLKDDRLVVWNDQFTYPLTLLKEQHVFKRTILEVLNGLKKKEDVKEGLATLRSLAIEGSQLKSFDTWYEPKNSRRHHPIPEMDILTF